MTFRLFKFPVHLSWTFLFMAAVLGSQREDLTLIAIWILVVFVSVLAHELGHAAVARGYGAAPAIFLHYMGGHTSFALAGRRRPSVLIALAGPGVGFLLGGAAYLVQTLSGAFTLSPLSVVYRDLLWINFGWGLINLLPTLPLDGGHILEALVEHPRRVVGVSLAVSSVAAGLGLWSGHIWAAVLFGVFAYSHIRELRVMPTGQSPARSQRLPVFHGLAQQSQSGRARLAGGPKSRTTAGPNPALQRTRFARR